MINAKKALSLNGIILLGDSFEDIIKFIIKKIKKITAATKNTIIFVLSEIINIFENPNDLNQRKSVTSATTPEIDKNTNITIASIEFNTQFFAIWGKY